MCKEEGTISGVGTFGEKLGQCPVLLLDRSHRVRFAPRWHGRVEPGLSRGLPQCKTRIWPHLEALRGLRSPPHPTREHMQPHRHKSTVQVYLLSISTPLVCRVGVSTHSRCQTKLFFWFKAPEKIVENKNRWKSKSSVTGRPKLPKLPGHQPGAATTTVSRYATLRPTQPNKGYFFLFFLSIFLSPCIFERWPTSDLKFFSGWYLPLN